MSSAQEAKVTSEVSLSEFDEEQAKYMDEEYVILVDPQDKVLGRATKYESHLSTKIKEGMLHRAFSLFLFNSKGELMIQQRAGVKITFPLLWANTCCSHPLHVESELIEENALGVKNAAIRKIEHELGVTELKPEDITFLHKIKYEACQDATWGEHEVDWLIFARKEVNVSLNENEVENIKWVTPESLRAMFQEAKEGKCKIAPWFQAITERFLFTWWERLDEILAKGGLPEDLKPTESVTDFGIPEGAKSAKDFLP